MAMIVPGVHGLGHLDGVGGSGQTRRLRLPPSWWVRPTLLWVNDLGLVYTFGSPQCGLRKPVSSHIL